MADKDKPEETTEKKKGLLGGSKVPLDAVLLVVAPFVTFVMLFMYVMGLLPPRPMTVKVVGAAPVEQPAEPATASADVPSPDSNVSGEDPMAGGDVPDQADVPSLAPEAVEVMTVDDGGSPPPEETTGEAAPEAAVTEEPVEDGPVSAAGGDVGRMERIKQLAKVYEQMNASSVAAIVTNMSEEDAVGILSNMKPRNAAKVLASLEPEQAAELSLRLTE